MAKNLLCEGGLIRDGYIQKGDIEKILRAVPNPRLDLRYTVLWNLLACEIWYGMYIRG